MLHFWVVFATQHPHHKAEEGCECAASAWKSQIHSVALSTGFGTGVVIKIVLRVRRTSGCTTVEILYSYVIWHILNT